MSYSSIGKSTIRKDGLEKIKGRVKYVNDYTFPGMLYAAVKSSIYAHAKIISIDTDAANKIPGVRAILTGEDYPFPQGCYLVDKPPLAVGKVRYYGEPVVAVVADSEEEAIHALGKVKIIYEELPIIKTASDALRDGAVLVHEALMDYPYRETILPENNSNVANRTKIRKGDMEVGYDNSDVVIEANFSIPIGDHAAIEPRVTIVEIKPDGQVIIHTSTQAPFLVRKLLSIYYKIPLRKIIVIAPPIGGGFGGKSGIQLEGLAYLLSKAVGGRPVKICNTRELDLVSSAGRNGFEAFIKLGSTFDGKLQVAEMTYLFDAGAYADYVVKISRAAAIACTGPYNIPNVWCDSLCVYTNKPYGTAFRGYGHTELAFAIERAMDILANKLKIDPVELRLLNGIEVGDSSPTNSVMDDNTGDLKECIRRVAKLIEWDDGSLIRVNDHTVRAKGISALWKATFMSSNTKDGALITFNDDGSINLQCGVMEIGQGTKTALSQIVAEKMRIPVESVNVCMEVNTQTSPYDWATIASRSLFMAGKAAIEAAEDLLKKILVIASKIFKYPIEELEFDNGRIFIKKQPDRSISLKDVALGNYPPELLVAEGQLIGRGNYVFQPIYEIDPETGVGRITLWTLGAEAVEVEINLEDYTYKVLKTACVMDVGKVINPALARGQVVGSISMALGMTTTEAFIFSRNQQVMNGSLRSYKLMRFGEEPEYLVDFLETPQKDGPFGARGLGEQAAIGIPGAIANALSRAVNAALNHLPLTPEVIWRACEKENKIIEEC